jgi:hypothetical protein
VATETLREFLVKLGFGIDAPTQKKFEEAITSATLKANLLATSFIDMAKQLAESLQRATGDLNNLYYTSVRVGSSATNIKAMTQAAQDFGVSAEEALGNIEALAQLLRTDPGKEGLVNSWGVKTHELNGEFRDIKDVINDIGKEFATRPDYMAQQMADLVNITYRYRKAISDPGYLADLEKHQKLLSAGGYEKAAKDAAVLEQQFRELGDRWDALKTRFAVNVFGPLIPQLEALSKWLDAHSVDIERGMTGISTAFRVAGNILKTSAEGWKLLYDAMKMLVDYVDTTFPKTVATLGKVLPVLEFFSNPIAFGLDKLGLKDALIEKLGLNDTPSAAGGGTLGIRNNNPGNLEYRGQTGAVRAGGSPFDRRFASFRTPQEGLAAMARQLELDSGRGLNNLTSLLGSYAPPGENDTAAYIADVAAKLHMGAGQSLNLSDPAMLSNLMNAMIAHEQGSNPYRAGDVRSAAEQAIHQAGGDVHMTQNNTININGAKDPAQTKQAVTDALADSYRKMTRNLQPTTQ